jgi:hypothetical protein
MPLHLLADGAPRVAILTPRWSEANEAGWALRQLAGALACAAEVHIITLEGTVASEFADGVFFVHRLGTADRAADLRRDIVLAAIGAAPAPGRLDGDDAGGSIDEILAKSLRAPWSSGAHLLRRIAPDLVVVADYRQLGALELVDEHCPATPMLLVPLAGAIEATILSMFAPVFHRAGAAVVFTDRESRLCVEHLAAEHVHFVGLPLAVNPSVLREPEPRVGGGRDYVLVLVDRPLPAGNRDPGLALLEMRFASHRVVVSGPSSLSVREPGGAPVQEWEEAIRSSDLLRLMAWAQVTVDLHPGGLFARRSLESLLHGTPIVVPADSSAREHAELGSAGLWFDNVGGLVWATEAMLDPTRRSVLGDQGQRYVQGRYGTTATFVSRIMAAIEDLAHGAEPLRRLGQEAVGLVDRFATGEVRTTISPSGAR